MSDQEQLTAVARERAEKRIDEAIGRLHAAAHEIGTELNIPEGIAGHSVDELLGRMAYVPSMARDLRRACGQELAKQELNQFLAGGPIDEGGDGNQQLPTSPPPPPPIDPSKIPGQIPVGMDVGDLDGVSNLTVDALRKNGLNKVGDIAAVPDEHLYKMPGLGEKSVAHVRAAIRKASGGNG